MLKESPCRQRGLNSEPLGYNDLESATLSLRQQDTFIHCASKTHSKIGTGKKGTEKRAQENWAQEKRAQENWAQEKRAQVKN